MDLPAEACLDAIRFSFAAWSNISDLTFTQVSSSSNANIIISWGTNFSSNSTLATTANTYNSSTMLSSRVTICFNENVTWKLDGSDIDLIEAAIHEIGHALGLHHSEYANAIMYPFYHFARDLTADDICGLWSIYGCPFSITGPSTVYGSSVYYIDHVPVDSRVNVEWSLSNSEFDANHLQENAPAANMCTITSDDNRVMYNETLTAKLYYNGDLLQTFTKDSISAPRIYFNGTYYNGQTTEYILLPSPLYVLPGTMVTINSVKLVGATVIQNGGNCTPSILSLDATNGVLLVGMPSTSGSVVVVKVFCSDGSTSILPIIATTGENLMSLSQSDGVLEVLVMPDYAIERFDGYEYCNIVSPSNWRLEMRDAITGAKVQDFLVSENLCRIETSGLKKGLYIIRAVIGKEVLGEKVFIR